MNMSWRATLRNTTYGVLGIAKAGGTAIAVLALVWTLSGVRSSTAAEPVDRTYPFSLSPRVALERFGEMRLGEAPVIGAEEWRVLDAAWAQRDAADADKRKPEYERLVVDALLTASGATTDAARAEYREKLKKVVEGARAAVEKGKPSVHPGESLMQFLHAGVMKEGYAEDQTSFTAIFDTGKHNCVSSTAMYYLVGRELGFEMRLIAIPGNRWMSGHACLDLIEGERTYEVEPTNSDGFDRAEKMKRPGVFSIGVRVDRKDGHFVDGLGLAASIYSNRGVAANSVKEPANADHLAAASLGFRALMCGPYERSDSGNVVAVFANWGRDLGKVGRYDEGLRALAFGFVATGNGDVQQNLIATSSDQIAELFRNKKDREAQTAIEKAAAALPQADQFQKSAPWFRYANRCYENEGYEVAMAVMDRALTTAPAADHPELREHRTGFLLSSSSGLLDKSDFDGALKLLVRAYKLDPSNGELIGSVRYHVQESLRKLAKGGTDPAAAVAHYRAVSTELPEVKDIGEVGISHARRTLSNLCDEQKFQEALAAVLVYAPVAGSVDQSERLTAQVYCEWGNYLGVQKKWTAAVEKYLEGLKLVPDSDRLRNAAVSTIDDWADVSMKTNDWAAAIAAYDRGLTYLPDSGHLKNNRDYCIAQKAKTGDGK